MLRRVKGCLASKPKDPKSDGVLVPADDPVTQPIRPTTPTSMDSPAANYQKARAVEQAVRQQAITVQWASRTGDRQPPYNLLELIGKGTYGRVYKAEHQLSGRTVAIKIIDLDSSDYECPPEARDENINAVLNEFLILQRLQGAENINQVFELHIVATQIWFVSEYCPGGSVNTLKRATGGKLDEKYIIVIARELAKALKACHNRHIMHRDVKAGNLMIHEDGNVQLIDFGVSGIIDSKVGKRSTIIGTLNWMPPEQLNFLEPAKSVGGRKTPAKKEFGIEVDTWAYGITLIEMATGIVPNFKEDRKGLARQLRREAPRLHTEDGFSSGLCDLVASVLVLDGASRPTMEEILDHPYLRDTDLNYPTSLLGELVTIYRYWALGGGQRLSLFHGGGAKEIEFPISRNNETWRFSKAPEIGRAGQAGSRTIYSLDPAIDIEATQSQEDNFNSLLPPDPADNKTLKAKIAAKKQEGIRRAEARLGSLFHPNHKGSGKLSTNMNPDPNHPHSDLLLRNNDHSESDVSLKDQGKKKPTFKGTPVDTIKANQPIQAKQRDTMAWDFPGIAAAPQDHQSSASEDPAVPQASQSSSQHDEVHATSDRLEVAQHLSSVPSHPVEPSTLEIPAVPEASQSFSQSNDFGAPNDDFEIDEHLSAAPSRPALRHAVTAPVPHVNATMNRMDLDALMNGTHTATRDAPRQSTRMDLDALMNEEAHNSSTNESHFNAFLPHDQQTVGDEGTATFGPGHSYGYSMPEALTGPHLGAAGPYDAAADDEDYGSAYENLSQSSMNASHRGYPFEAAGPYDTAAAEDDGYPYDNLSQSSIYASSSHHGYPNPPSEHNIETAGPYDRAAAEDDGYPYDNLSQSSIYASSSHHGYPDPRTDHDIEAAGPYDTAAAEDDGYPYDNLSQSSMNASSSHHGYPDQRTEHNPDAPGRYDTAADEDDGLPYDSLSQSSMNASNHGYTESLRTPSSQQGARRTQPATNGTTSDYPEPLRTPSSQHGGRSRTQAAMNGTSSDYPEPLRTPSSPQGIGRTQPATSGGSSDYPEPLRTPNNGGHTRATSPPFDPFAFDPNFDPTFDNPDEFVDIPTPQPPSVESMTEGSSPEVVLAEYRRILRDWNFGLAATAHNWQKVLRDMEAQDERKRREDEGSH